MNGWLVALLALLLLTFCIVAALVAFCLTRTKKSRRSTIGSDRDEYGSQYSSQAYEEGQPFMYPGHTGINPGSFPQQTAVDPYTQGGYTMYPSPGFAPPDYAQSSFGMAPGTRYEEQSAFTVY